MAKAPRLLLAGAVTLLGVTSPAVCRAENLSSAGTVTAVAGPVTVARLSGTPQPLRFRDSLFWRDVVEARKDGIARVLLAGKTTVTVRELSRLELREEVMAEGIRYTAELVSGKVRASVARMLMRPGDQVEIRTKNAVASVRGTDFIVETLAVPSRARAFGLLAVRQVAQVIDSGSPAGETVVVTLSGAVDVSNPLAGGGRVEQVGAYEAVRVSGRQDPVRFQLSADDLRVLLQGLMPPRPQEARSGDKSDAVGTQVERVALATSAQSVRVFEQAGGGGGSARSGGDDDDQTAQAATQSQSQGNGNGLAVGQVSGQEDVKPEKADIPDKQEGTKPEKVDKPDKGSAVGQSNAQPATSTASTSAAQDPAKSGKTDKPDKPDKGSAVGQSNAQPATSTASTGVTQDPGRPDKGLGAGPSKSQGSGQGNGLALGQGNAGGQGNAQPSVTPPTPAAPAAPATPAVVATPATPAAPAAATSPATPAAPSTPATAAVAPAPAALAAPAAAASPAAGQAAGKPATPPGQAKK